jgi:acyl-coenzyme A synthetase/AMP-(fatty) acid ligase
MKRAVLCVADPENYIPQLDNYSLMIINPAINTTRLDYLLDKADWSLLITKDGEKFRDGNDYTNERALWYTSGTTGDSKFVSFSQTQLDLVGQTICRDYDITSNDRYLSTMPLWHAHGQGMYWASQQAHCEVKYIQPKELKNKINFDPTFISAIPDLLKIFTKQKFTNLRFVRSASASLPDQMYYDLKSWARVPVIEAFGMTEAGSHCFTNPLNGEQRVGTVGLPAGIEAKIVDGILYIQGPSVFQPGWYNTGDYADQDEHGYFRILGRVVDRLNIKGYKIDPASIENHLYNMLPRLKEVAVFGDTIVKCVYTGDIAPADIKKTLITIDPHCVPKILKQVIEIPRNSAGKISRSMLNELYK